MQNVTEAQEFTRNHSSECTQRKALNNYAADPNTNANTNADADANANTNADANANADADTNADTDTDTNTDPNANAVNVVGGQSDFCLGRVLPGPRPRDHDCRSRCERLATRAPRDCCA